MFNTLITLIHFEGFYRNLRFNPDKQSASPLETKVNELTKKMGIKKKVHLITCKNKGELDGSSKFQAFGHNIFGGKIAIKVPESLSGAQESFATEAAFPLAHELSHLKNNDIFWASLISPIIGIAATIFTYQFCEFALADMIGAGVSFVFLVKYHRYQERQADLEALKYTSKEEKEFGLELFNKTLKDELKYRNDPKNSIFDSLFAKIYISPEGNSRYDLAHPPRTERIKMIAESLK